MNKKIVSSIVIVALIFVGYILRERLTRKEVKVYKIEQGKSLTSILYAGVVAPGEVVPVYIEAPALIESLMARLGQEVEVGDKLMTFSSKSIIENDRELKINELDIKDVNLKIDDLEGGSLKLELDNRKLEMRSLEDKIKGDERRLPVLAAEVRALKEKVEAYKKLWVADGVSSLEVNKVITEADKKNVEFEDLKMSLELNRQKFELSAVSFESLTRELQIEEAKLKSTLEKLQLSHDILARRAEQLKKPLEAPVDGVITGIDVTEGSNAFSGQRLLSISPKGRSTVKVEIPLYQSSIVKVNQKGIIKDSSSKGEVYTGIVSRVSNVARESLLGGKNDKVVEAEIIIENTNNLKPGFIVDVEIINESSNDLVTVPSFSIIEEGNKSYVFVVEDGKAYKKEVEIGVRGSSEYEILNIPLGTEVIVNPFKVSSGERVKAVI